MQLGQGVMIFIELVSIDNEILFFYKMEQIDDISNMKLFDFIIKCYFYGLMLQYTNEDKKF